MSIIHIIELGPFKKLHLPPSDKAGRTQALPFRELDSRLVGWAVLLSRSCDVIQCRHSRVTANEFLLSVPGSRRASKTARGGSKTPRIGLVFRREHLTFS